MWKCHNHASRLSASRRGWPLDKNKTPPGFLTRRYTGRSKASLLHCYAFSHRGAWSLCFTRILPRCHRTKRAKGCLSRDSMLHMMFKLSQCAEGKWRKLRGFGFLSKGVQVISDNQVAAWFNTQTPDLMEWSAPLPKRPQKGRDVNVI